jgi:cytochrome P450 family 110
MQALPPGPGSRVISAIRYLRAPYRTLLSSASRYGDPFTWPSVFGKLVVTGDPDGVRTLLSAPPEAYSALGAELLAPVLGASNLILLSGEEHRTQRKLQSPPFHGPRLQGWGRLILEVAAQHIERLPRGQRFSAHRTMQEIALDVILQVAMGIADPVKRQDFRRAVLGLFASLKPSFMLFPGLRRPLFGLSAWARFQRASERLSSLVTSELRERRQESVPREDILGTLLAARRDDGSALSDREVLESISSIVGAGHETTASALAFALQRLHRDSRVRGLAVDELAGMPPGPLDPGAVVALPYLDAVCQETLRLDPVAPLIGRTLREDLTLKGHRLPAGISVGIAIVNLHRRPDLYPEPERFLPERFLGRQRGGFEYLPFGGGTRRCLGAAFAMYEMKLVLASLLRAGGMTLVSEAPVRPVVRNTTVGPAGGVYMCLQP